MNKKKRGLLIGRWQTLHSGHDWLVEQVEHRGLRPIMAIRDTPVDDLNPHSTMERAMAIKNRYGERVDVIVIPDIIGVYYGRKVGYDVVELKPPKEIATISGRKIRAKD